jgi:hypothetical protein
MKFGALPLAFEFNDRYPAQKLTVKDLQDIGADFVNILGAFAETPEGKESLARTQDYLVKRSQDRMAYFKNTEHDIDNIERLLALGY